jgi:bacillolysin
MRKILQLSLTATCLFFIMNANAQKTLKGDPGMYPEYIDFRDAPQTFTNGKVFLADEAGRITSNAGGVLNHKETDAVGMEHYRYQQSFAGIPVEHAVYIMHVKAGKVNSQNGAWVKDFPSDLNKTASIDANTALQRAMTYVGAKTYKWQLPAEEEFLKREQKNSNATFFPKAELVFYGGEERIKPSQLRLAYKLDIYANYPLSRQIVFVDAQNGSILGKRELIHTVNAPGTATTAYSGSQSITTDNTGTTFRLRETGRGNGINTFNMKNAGTNYAAAVDFTDADNNWNNVNANKDQYATDGHWGTEKTYDYFFTKFNRNSVDNAGLALNSYVHTNLVAFGYPDNVNAFWDGSRMTYGDGNATYAPLTALDIAGHEITHGLTERTSNLVYAGESGAMNEGFSDIFGTAVEFYARPSRANWTIGEDIGASFRSMSNPNQFGQPDTYLGTNWVTVAGCTPSNNNDQCGVHTNSGVLNFWFYLLSVGGSGTNDKGTAYNVTGIGIDKAGAIAFRTNTVYLVSTSNYANARTFAIKAAEDLYGVGSVEATQTANAWTAVGVGGTVVSACTTAFEANETLATAAAITSGVTNSAAIGSSTDIDYYKIVTTATGTNAFNLVGPTGVDYDMYIYNSAGTQIGAGTGSTATETVSLTSQAAGTYYIKVIGYNGANSATCYTIKATATATGTGCQSALDNTTNGTIGGAAVIPFNTNVTGLINPAGDNDYYKFVITTGGTATVTLTTLPGDYDLTVVNSAGTQLAISENGGTTGETITRTYTAGTYYARVFGFNNASSASTCYTLKVQLGTATLEGITGTGSVSKGLLKVYPNPVSNILNVSVLGDMSGAKTNIQIIDLAGRVLVTKNNTGTIQSIDISKLPKGVYMLRATNGVKEVIAKFTKQ